MKLIKYFLILLFCFLITNLNAKENFFQDAKSKYDEKELEESKFLFQRNIVFNPKDAKSYLYLAKIYNAEKNQLEEEKNLNTTLLLEPSNEEAMLMLIKIELKKSNYSKVSELSKAFELVCTKFCKDLIEINENLKDIETKNDS